MVTSDQLHAVVASSLRTPVRIGGWMGSGEDLDVLENGKISCPYSESKELWSVIQPVTISDPK